MIKTTLNLLLLAVFLPFGLPAQEQFLDAETIVSFNFTTGEDFVEAVDLDNDGDEDLVIVTHNFITLLVRQDDGSLMLDENQLPLNSNGGPEVSFVDIDEDLLVDLVYIDHFAKKIFWRRNLGAASFSQPIELFDYTMGNYRELRVLDFDQDNDQDVLLVYTYGLLLIENLGEGTFSDGLTIADFSYGQLLLEDLDADGDVDIILASISQLAWLENTIDGYAPLQVIFTDFLYTNSVHLLDLDEDGNRDIYFNPDLLNDDTERRVLTKIENLGNGNFGSIETYGYLNSINPILVLDVGNDGDLDIVIPESELRVFVNAGQGILLEKIITEGAPTTQYFNRLADLNGDGYMDILADDQEGLNWIRNGPKGLSEPIPLDSIPWQSLFKGMYDFNGDGFKDIIVNVQLDIQWMEYDADHLDASFEVVSECAQELINTSSVDFNHFTVNWDFGNGITSNEIHPAWPFQELGLYDVSLTVCIDGECDEQSQVVEVSHCVDHNKPTQATVNQVVAFEDASCNYTNWTWVFGDGAVSTEQNASHTYEEAGIYPVELYLTDATQIACTYQSCWLIEVSEPTFVANQVSISAQIVPNPVSDVLSIEASSDLTLSPFTIYERSGRVCSSGLLDASAKVKTSGLAPGVYYLEVRLADGSSVTEAFIKL